MLILQSCTAHLPPCAPFHCYSFAKGSAKPNLARSSSSDSVGGASGGGGIGGGGAIGISAVSSYVPPLSKVPDVIRRGGVPAASGGSTRGAAPGAPLKSISELFNYGSVDFSAVSIVPMWVRIGRSDGRGRDGGLVGGAIPCNTSERSVLSLSPSFNHLLAA
jgi:hypothetical protein